MRNMRSFPPRVLAAALLASVSFASTAALAQQTTPQVRIVGPIDENHLVTLKGNTHPAAIAANDRGPVSASLPLNDLTMVLSRSPERQAAFDAYVQGEYNPNSENFHQWLTPEEIGERYGPSETDIATITNWLAAQGFTVMQVAPDRMTIKFNGTAAKAESAFHTQIHNLMVNGTPHYANMSDPQIPEALAPVVVGIKALHNFLPRPMHKLGSKVEFDSSIGKWRRVTATVTANGSASTHAAAGTAFSAKPRPMFGINGDAGTQDAYLEEDVAPFDFATIYNVLPLWNASTPIKGTGQTIAIAGTSDIDLSDVSTFRSAFGLSAGSTPQEIDTGMGPAATECTSTDPSAFCGIGDLVENSLDVEWSGAVAPNAQIDLVVTGQNAQGTVDTLFDSAQYVVQHDTAKILSVSYGACELFNGTTANAAYYSLWQSAAAEGIAVFVATGDSGAPACDQGGDSLGYPYSAQYGLSVSGFASTPFNVAVGGTDFSWCQGYFDSNGNYVDCPTSSTSQGTPAYWNTSNNSSTGASAAGYVPETPWNDSCDNPIWAKYFESFATDSELATGLTTPEEACNFIQAAWPTIDEDYDFMPATWVDTVGGGGGVSNCVVNNTTFTATSETIGTCNSGSTSVSTANGTVSLTDDGWQKPSWQAGVNGIPSDGVRDLPDVSFFAGDGTLDSATLICVSAIGACTYSPTTENYAMEVGGTSVGTPEMAGVMALINQKWGNQGLPNPELYKLGGEENYSGCSSESVTTGSSSCYFNDVDQGTNAMPCDYGATLGGTEYDGASGGWVESQTYSGIISPNCTALNSSVDASLEGSSSLLVGTMVSTGTTEAYNAAQGYDLATGLGSLNVANVVNASGVWAQVGSKVATVTVTPASGSINPSQSLQVTITAAGASGTPTGKVTLAGGGYTSAATTLSSGSASITIPADSLTGTGNSFSVTLTATYSGDPTYASETGTNSVTVTKLNTSSVLVVPAFPVINSNVSLSVAVTVNVPNGDPTPTGKVTLTAGSFTASTTSLPGGVATITVPANTFTASGSVTLNANYSGDLNYAAATGSNSVTVNYQQITTPIVAVTPATSSLDSSQSLNVSITVGSVSGTGSPNAEGTVVLTATGGYSSTSTTLTNGDTTITIPANTFTNAGTVTLTATYTAGNGSLFATNVSGTSTINVAQSVYTVTVPTAPTAISSPGGSTTAAVQVSTSTAYGGTVTLGCAVTSPVGESDAPTCTASGSTSVTLSSGTTSGSVNFTVNTTSSSAAVVHPDFGIGKGLMGAGGGAVLAVLVFFGIPARRRSWRAMLGMLVFLVTLGALSACGGSVSGGGGGGNTGTPTGAYTFTVTATGNPSVTPVPSTSFSVTVN